MFKLSEAFPQEKHQPTDKTLTLASNYQGIQQENYA